MNETKHSDNDCLTPTKTSGYQNVGQTQTESFPALQLVGTETIGADCKVFNLELGEWPRPEVTHPRSKPISQLTSELEERGYASRLTKARQRIAERASVPDEPRSLRELRLAAGFSQTQLAERIETSQSRIARLEAGHEDPGLRTLKRLAIALEVDLNTIAEAFE
ncbi:MAG: helix-turn-helix transcriptional regulator [Proteobacteria bacterium]|nr:helix-turn-helix transcriptional regulator [Pseudomonadota bacterium]